MMILDMLGLGACTKLLESLTISHVGPLTIYTYGVLLAAAYLLGLQLALVACAESAGSTRTA